MTMTQCVGSSTTSATSSTSKVVSIASARPRTLISENASVWNEEVSNRLQDLIRLNYGWDGYNARPVGFVNATFALQMLNNICGPATPAPQIVPGVNGDLQLEWHTLQGDIELHVEGPNNVHAWRALVGDLDGEELNLTVDFAAIAQWVRDITEPPIAAATAA